MNGTVLYLQRDSASPPDVCERCLLNANNMAAECRAGDKRGLHATTVTGKLRTSPAQDLEAVAWSTGSEPTR